MVLSLEWRPRTAVSIVRQGLEYVFDERPLSRLQSPVGVDLVSALPGMGPSRRLVRAAHLMPPEPISRRLLQHFLAALAYRTQKALRDAPDSMLRQVELAERVLLSHSGLSRLIDRKPITAGSGPAA